jgi:hypothetical protein
MSPANDPQDRRPLTAKQERVLRALVLWTARRRRQPSYGELARALGVPAVQNAITELAAKGWLGLTGQARAIEIPADVYQSIIEVGELPAAAPGEAGKE